VYSSPAVANGVLYIGSWDNNVYALNASTGTELWSYATGGQVHSSPAVTNGVVYVGSDDGKVYAFGLKKGQE
jgi:outer membrane protein assembly factor BamB